MHKTVPKKGTNPSGVMKIPAYTQKVNHEFLGRKKGIIMQKSKSTYEFVPIM